MGDALTDILDARLILNFSKSGAAMVNTGLLDWWMEPNPLGPIEHVSETIGVDECVGVSGMPLMMYLHPLRSFFH
jgi:hypothetical protein